LNGGKGAVKKEKRAGLPLSAPRKKKEEKKEKRKRLHPSEGKQRGKKKKKGVTSFLLNGEEDLPWVWGKRKEKRGEFS